MRGHGSYVYSVDFSPRGDLIASAGFRHLDRTVRLWSAIDGKPVGEPSDVSDDSWAVFTQGGDALVLRREESGPVQALQVPGRKLLDSTRFDGISPLGAIQDAPGDEWLEHLRETVGRERYLAAPSLDHGVYVWNWRSGEKRRLTGHTDLVFAVAFSPDGERLASGSNDTRILLWDVDTWEITLELADHDSYIFSLAWSPDGTQLVSGGGDMTERIWDSEPWAERHRQRLEQRKPR